MTTAYSNPGGSGDRRDLIILGLLGGLYLSPTNQLPLAILDGAKTGTDSTAWSFINGSSGNGMIFDFGPTGFKQVIDEFTWYQNNSTNHGTWAFEGSDDLASWTTLATGFNLATAATSVHAFTNTTAYRYYRLVQLTGTASNSPWCEEIEFKIEAGDPITEDVPAWITGDRNSRITATTTGTLTGAGSRPITNILDGVTTGTGVSFNSSQSGVEIRFDFGIATVVADVRMYCNTTSASSGDWKWQGSNDGSSWDDLGPAVRWRLNGSSSFPLCNFPWLGCNRTAYRYYRMLLANGTTGSTCEIRELEFREVEIPSEPPSEPPSESPSEPPSETPSEPPSEQSSEIPSEPPSEIPSEPPSEAPSEPPSESESEPPAPLRPMGQTIFIGFGFGF